MEKVERIQRKILKSDQLYDVMLTKKAEEGHFLFGLFLGWMIFQSI